MRTSWEEIARLGAGVAAVLGVTALYTRWLDVSNATTAALTFLLIVLVVAATSRLWVAAATSVVAMLTFNFSFLPPVGTWTIADPQNWIALFAFLAVSLVATNLSARARSRTREALDRRDELARLFDLSRDVLLSTEGRQALAALARSVARRFDLAYVAIALPQGTTWEVVEAGPLQISLDLKELSLAFAGAQNSLEFDASTRTYSGHRVVEAGEHSVRLVPLRIGTKPVGLLAASGRSIEAGTLDALAAIVAIAVERAALLDERKAAEVARRGEELKTALLGSLAHDLRTPLTAIRVAASNVQASASDPDRLKEQSGVILDEAARLTRLFENILEMARIDAGSVSTEMRWAHPSEIVAAARDQVESALHNRPLEVNAADDTLVRIDPRLTASALAHVIENAAQYAPAGSPMEVAARVTGEGLVITVRDHGPGIAPADLPRLFERFYRGAEAKAHSSGTGMGLSIARGLLAAEQGRIWGENCPDGGAMFTVVVPGEIKGARFAAGRFVMTRTSLILLVDDEASIQRTLGPLLRSHGYEVVSAITGQSAVTLAGERSPDLIVLDLGLPDLDGTEVCRRIREKSKVPIIILSARGGEADKVRALDLGADDFVTKPFGPEELLARIRVALRRVLADDADTTGHLLAGDLTIDYDRRRVVRGEDEIRLTPKEFELLSLLAKNHDRVLTHRAILKAVWGPNAVNQPEHLWALVAQLRKKIEPDPGNPRYLLSEPWVGYRFATGDSEGSS